MWNCGSMGLRPQQAERTNQAQPTQLGLWEG